MTEAKQAIPGTDGVLPTLQVPTLPEEGATWKWDFGLGRDPKP